ncbi:MAG TPA: PLP-dependent aminotransferase family protein [Microbacteriaceae bacterium]
MTDRWANFGLDLHLELDPARKGRSLEDALRSAIHDGRLAQGTRLPASRVLASDLGMARNSVADAYGQLTAEGWLEARTGSGTWVSARMDTQSGTGTGRVDRPRSAATATTVVQRASRPRALALDLRGGIPDASMFPRAGWAAAARRAVNGAAPADLGYPAAQGAGRLRDTLAEYLTRARGVFAAPEHVLITHGFGELLSLTCRVLCASGARRIAVEEYGHELHRSIMSAAGMEVIPIRVDAEGAIVAELESVGADAVLLTAAHQFPIGVPLSAARRAEVTRWAERTGGLIIEDDYDGEFRYDRRSIGALQALAPQQVLYVGTASKSLAPAVGLAWSVVPDRLISPLLEERRGLGAAADTLTQLTLAEFMQNHHYDRHVRQLRAHYRLRREELEATFAALVPHAKLSGLSAGLHCLVELPASVAEARVTTEAVARGLAFEGLTDFLPAGRVPSRAPAMVVGYGAPPEHRYAQAIAAAAEAIAAAMVAPAR